MRKCERRSDEKFHAFEGQETLFSPSLCPGSCMIFLKTLDPGLNNDYFIILMNSHLKSQVLWLCTRIC